MAILSCLWLVLEVALAFVGGYGITGPLALAHHIAGVPHRTGTRIQTDWADTGQVSQQSTSRPLLRCLKRVVSRARGQIGQVDDALSNPGTISGPGSVHSPTPNSNDSGSASSASTAHLPSIPSCSTTVLVRNSVDPRAANSNGNLVSSCVAVPLTA